VTGKPITINQRAPGKRFPPLLEQIVHRALAKRPEERFATAADFGTALQWVLNGAAQLPAHLAPPTTPTPAAAEVRSVPALAGQAIGSLRGASKPTLPDLSGTRRGMSVQLLVAVAVGFTLLGVALALVLMKLLAR
jgi:serine/threonine-protein kinase